jgi:hypothetical protein
MLGLVVSVLIAGALFVAIVTAGDTCGDSATAGTIEAIGAIVILIGLGAVCLRRRGRLLALVPGAVPVTAVWLVVVAHLVPGGSGGCFQ